MKQFERLLFTTRLIVFIPVIVATLMAILVIVLSTLDAARLVGQGWSMFDGSLSEVARTDLDRLILGKVIELIDDFLLGSFLIVFAFGLYELFINKIDEIEDSQVASRILVIHSLDDLKGRLANVVLLILIVKFFQVAIGLKYKDITDLLLLSVGIGLIGLTLYLSNRGHAAHD